jgi:3-dehydroquinate synthase
LIEDGGPSRVLSLNVRSSAGTYEVRISSGLLAQGVTADFGIIDANLVEPERWNFTATETLFASEDDKSLDSVSRMLRGMADAKISRQSRVLALGGGTVQDVATLSFSLYMRGVQWTYIPSTLMSMVDSCIGGKSSINFEGRKNLIGNFFPPSEVLVDPSIAASQSALGKISGLSEAAKIHFASGGDSFQDFLGNPASLQPGVGEDLDRLVWTTLTAKKWFIEEDEFDLGARRLLNFGHTFGHALEAASSFRIPHGIAIGLGMLAAVEFSSVKTQSLIDDLCVYLTRLLQPIKSEIATWKADVDWAVFRKGIAHDKKSSKEFLVFVIPHEDGSLKISSYSNKTRVLERSAEAMQTAFLRVGV